MAYWVSLWPLEARIWHTVQFLRDRRCLRMQLQCLQQQGQFALMLAALDYQPMCIQRWLSLLPSSWELRRERKDTKWSGNEQQQQLMRVCLFTNRCLSRSHAHSFSCFFHFRHTSAIKKMKIFGFVSFREVQKFNQFKANNSNLPH